MVEKRNNQIYRASMTLEAAVVFPIFILTILMLYSSFALFHFYGGLQSELAKEAQRVAVYSAAKEIISPAIGGESAGRESLGADNSGIDVSDIATKVMSNIYIENEVRKRLDAETLEKAGIQNLRFTTSYLSSGTTVVDTVVMYTMEPRFNFIGMSGIPFINRARVKVWNGYEQRQTVEEEERYVYITETGEVYHLTETCSHIDLTIIPVSREYIYELRTANQERYKACELCGVGTDALMYITDTGDRVHSSLTCSSLKRSVQRVPLSSCEGMNCCSRCAGTAP